MQNNKDVTFIRKHGKIIPIRKKTGKKLEVTTKRTLKVYNVASKRAQRSFKKGEKEKVVFKIGAASGVLGALTGALVARGEKLKLKAGSKVALGFGAGFAALGTLAGLTQKKAFDEKIYKKEIKKGFSKFRKK
jgi:hypothetical protein